MRKLRKQPTGPLNPWDFGAEPSDRVYEPRPDKDCAFIYDLRESRGRNKAAAGELTPQLVVKDGKPRQAVLDDDGLWYWLR